MKKSYLVLAIILFLFSGGCKEKQVDLFANDDVTDRILVMSERVDVLNYVVDEFVIDGYEDDDSVIIYAGNEFTGSNCDIEEFTEFDRDASDETLSKIQNTHIPELEKIRKKVGEPIIIRSAARSYSHELRMGRKGTSQHVYNRGKGAVDISLNNFTKKNSIN